MLIAGSAWQSCKEPRRTSTHTESASVGTRARGRAGEHRKHAWARVRKHERAQARASMRACTIAKVCLNMCASPLPPAPPELADREAPPPLHGAVHQVTTTCWLLDHPPARESQQADPPHTLLHVVARGVTTTRWPLARPPARTSGLAELRAKDAATKSEGQSRQWGHSGNWSKIKSADESSPTNALTADAKLSMRSANNASRLHHFGKKPRL